MKAAIVASPIPVTRHERHGYSRRTFTRRATRSAPVIAHQHKRVNLRPETARQISRPSEKPSSILVGLIDHLPVVAHSSQGTSQDASEISHVAPPQQHPQFRALRDR